MTITRSYTQPKTGACLMLHTYVDDDTAGGQIVLTAEMVPKGEAPTKSGIVEAVYNEWLIISIKNNGAAIAWVEKPTVRGTNEYNVDGPAFDHGYVLPSAATVGSFGNSIGAGDEQAMKVNTSLVGWGILLQADAPGQNLDLSIYVLNKLSKRNT